MISNKYCWNLFYCIFLVVNSTKAEKALINEEKVDLIQNLLRWMKGFDVLAEQRCFTLNFGYQQPFPFSQLWLDLDSTLPLNVGSLGNKSPNKCHIVIIAGQYLDKVDEFMRMVDRITEVCNIRMLFPG